MADHEPVILEVEGEGEQAAGWSYLWLKYVWGFKPQFHCANCLTGRFSKWVRPGMRLREPHALDEAPSFDYLYLCGIPAGGRWRDNLHFPLVPEPGKRCRIQASTGHIFHATNARRLWIPALPKDFDGRDWRFTTCRNWRFGVSRYGLAPKPPASA